MVTMDMINLAKTVMPQVLERLQLDLGHYSGDLAMTQMVVQDAADQLQVLELLSDGDSAAALDKFNWMDTAPREDLYVLLMEAGGAELFEQEAA